MRRRPLKSKNSSVPHCARVRVCSSLSDERGRRFLIHTAKIAYVEIGVADARRVGFGMGPKSGKHAGKATKSE